MLLQSVQFCCDKISDFETEISRLNDYVKKTDQLYTENDMLKAEMGSLRNRLGELEQAARLNNVEIQGVPEKNDENLLHIVEKIVRFTSRGERDRFLMAVRNKRKNIKTPRMSLNGVSGEFFVNEHLTLNNEILYKEARIAAKNKGYKYVWVRNGIVFCRKTDTSGIFVLKNSDSVGRM
ncbi:uncharacterized protein LOC123322311 [Coccinella septempunctata]|uniref:uncharacterized protein LOC123322311 n=1 Tax=Coccinella septempunctata TaxID=41139 RepID=UPI001D07203E|nr:uncharacterized protein LOC123322311 [Coccinella septempunctata]